MNPGFRLLLALLFAAPHVGRTSEGSDPLTLSSGLQLYELREDAPPEELEVYTAYQEARQLEEEIIRMYREIRAAELTRVQRQTLQRSLESVLMPLSDRAEVDRERLTGRAAGAEDVERYQQELAVVMRETRAMVSNAEDLLESLVDKEAPPASEQSQAKRERAEERMEERSEEPTNQEQMDREQMDREQMEQAQMERAQAERLEESSASREMREQLARERQEAIERKREEADAELEKTGMHLEEALEEIRAAREEVAREEAEREEAEREKTESEKKEALEKSEALASLKEKIDKAEVAVEAVVEKVNALGDVANVDLGEAEKAIVAMREAMREAMGRVNEADKTAEKEAKSATRERTAEALRQMEAANTSLAKAADAIRSAKEMSSEEEGDGGDGGDGGGGGSIARLQALGKLARAESGQWVDLTPQMRGERLREAPNVPLPAERPALWAGLEELIQSPAARRFSARTPKDVWIFVGDWYVLGRYDNQGRANIEKVYPPESIVDLNAQYLSEDGRTLRWEYESYPPPMVRPYGWESWKIYYFYTELYFEEEAEVWIAVGSDDRSDLWINDLPVWHSANRHKGWNPAEGFRKVVFRQGRNRLLLRLENGQSSLGFSLYLNFH